MPYLSYLLRLWMEDGWEGGQTGCGQGEWRASLQDPHTQEMQVFANLEALFEFLSRETEQRVSTEDARSSIFTSGVR